MKIIITNENGDQIQRNIELHMSDIKECCYEYSSTKSGKNESYFLIYLHILETESGDLTRFETKIPFEYENRSGKFVPIYEEKLSSCTLYIDGELTECELSDDEQLILASTCVKALLEDFVYSCVEYKEAVL